MNEKIDIPVWEKYTLTIEEASRYFTIGQNKLRRLVEENRHGRSEERRVGKEC